MIAIAANGMQSKIKQKNDKFTKRRYFEVDSFTS